MKEIRLQEIENKFNLSRGLFGCPPVTKNNNGYQIRIQTGIKINYNRGITNISWDYFMTDKKGIIYKSPRGYAKEYNKKVKIIDIEEKSYITSVSA